MHINFRKKALKLSTALRHGCTCTCLCPFWIHSPGLSHCKSPLYRISVSKNWPLFVSKGVFCPGSVAHLPGSVSGPHSGCRLCLQHKQLYNIERETEWK